ncbi:MAG: hypothetical protein MZV64_28070 [Ignavibacteriales bacterium]|nr:hypothetical protein [Ignavibacteriales bacterium]
MIGWLKERGFLLRRTAAARRSASTTSRGSPSAARSRSSATRACSGSPTSARRSASTRGVNIKLMKSTGMREAHEDAAARARRWA